MGNPGAYPLSPVGGWGEVTEKDGATAEMDGKV